MMEDTTAIVEVEGARHKGRMSEKGETLGVSVEMIIRSDCNDQGVRWQNAAGVYADRVVW